MKTTMKIDDVKVKGNIDAEGTLHKNIIIKVTMPYTEEGLAFLGGHVEETVRAVIDTEQTEFSYPESPE